MGAGYYFKIYKPKHEFAEEEEYEEEAEEDEEEEEFREYGFEDEE